MTDILEGRMAPISDPDRDAVTRSAVQWAIGCTTFAFACHPFYLFGAHVGAWLAS